VNYISAQPNEAHNLYFDQIPSKWDEGLPMGNGLLGTLIWEKDKNLRFALDRVDLWDERPMVGIDRPEFTYDWIYQQVLKNEYKIVQDYFDAPYDREPAPTKIPGAAIEFKIDQKALKSIVQINSATAEIIYSGGTRVQSFVHASLPIGWFKIINGSKALIPSLSTPEYTSGKVEENPNSLIGDNLIRLGYKQGTLEKKDNSIFYQQPGWGNFSYDVYVKWQWEGDTLIGAWSISTSKSKESAKTNVDLAFERGFDKDLVEHLKWWEKFWDKSSISIPDTILEKQWYLEQYKFGSVARKGLPAISLQAIWTADNGRIPPWKGDFHHDLNTQLSYWPSYSANHLEQAEGFIDYLERCKPSFERFTKKFFNAKGLSVPGVTALDGTEMGGWTQYSCSPTTSAWLAQHYYLQWRYSMDRDFLKTKAYPWFNQVAVFIEEITIKDQYGKRKLPLSSSPEINDNRIDAWFLELTNYDLSLIKYVLSHASELATELGYYDKAKHWDSLLNEFPEYSLTKKNQLKFAPNLPYQVSHRHFSHLMAIHPLSMINWEDGEKSQQIILNTIQDLEKFGPDYWVGYSWAWLGNLKARAKDGEGAANALNIFAKAFCSANSFHVNGDQTKTGYSKLTYRPFTLEGNFAFAAGIQEMLLQSYYNYIHVFPAIPKSWGTVSFKDLRAEGGFLISASQSKAGISFVKIKAESGGLLSVKLPFKKFYIKTKKNQLGELIESSEVFSRNLKAGEEILFEEYIQSKKT